MSDQNVQYTLTLRDLLSSQLANANNLAKQLEGTMGGLQSTINKVGMAAGIAFSIGEIKDFIGSVVSAGSKVEDARTGLTTLLKDSAAANEVIKNTMEDATKTPFSFESLLAANKSLISANVSAEDARSAVLDLANAIAATGGGNAEMERMVINLQQIKNAGKASAVDVKQFAIAGINVYEALAKATGKTADQVTGVEVTYNDLTKALKIAHEAGGIYANGLENMAGNTSVKISNIGDAIFQLKVRMFDDLKPAIDTIINASANFIDTLGTLWDWLVKHKEIIKDIGNVLLIAGGAWLTYKGIMLGALAVTKASLIWQSLQYASIVLLGDGMLTASAITKAWAGIQVILNDAFKANPIGFIIASIAFLVSWVTLLYNKFSWFRGGVWALWAVIKEFGSIVVDYFKGLYNVITGVLTGDLGQIKEGWKQLESSTFGAFKRIGDAAQRGYKAGVDNFAKDNPAGTDAPKPVTAGGGKGGKTDNTKTTTDTGTSKVSGTKSITINMRIDNLVREFKVSTTTVTGSTTKIKELITQALLSATNDAQIVAGQ